MWSVQRTFLNKIINKEYSVRNLKEKNQRFRQIFLTFASETEENLECLKHLEYGKLREEESGKETSGIKIKGKDILISDIMNALEGLDDIPDPVREYYPDLTDREWHAAARLVTVLLLLLEKTEPDVADMVHENI